MSLTDFETAAVGRFFDGGIVNSAQYVATRFMHDRDGAEYEVRRCGVTELVGLAHVFVERRTEHHTEGVAEDIPRGKHSLVGVAAIPGSREC